MPGKTKAPFYKSPRNHYKKMPLVTYWLITAIGIIKENAQKRERHSDVSSWYHFQKSGEGVESPFVANSLKKYIDNSLSITWSRSVSCEAVAKWNGHSGFIDGHVSLMLRSEIVQGRNMLLQEGRAEDWTWSGLPFGTLWRLLCRKAIFERNPELSTIAPEDGDRAV